MTIEELAKRVEQIIKTGEKQSVCHKIKDCNYIFDEIKKVEMTVPQAHGYLVLICEKYPGACKLNEYLENLK